MNFYVVVGDNNGVADIAAVDVTVRYPNGVEKFQLRAIKNPNDGWIATGGPFPNPAPYTWPAPSWVVRQLKFTVPSTWDRVDANADGDTNDAGDLIVPEFLAVYGNRVTYGLNSDGTPYTTAQVVADIQAGKQVMLELVGYIWFHQPATRYTVEVTGTDKSGATSNPLVNSFVYESIVSLFTDFSNISFGSLNIGSTNLKYGDNDITTPLKPTVWNNGNDPAMLLVDATKMLLNGEPNNANILGKFIDDFDVTLDRKDPANGAILQTGTVWFVSASDPMLIVDAQGVPVLLPSCIPAQIDFSVHPSFGTLAGNYSGTFTLTIQHYVDNG
jgi:hypothetical protein